MGENIIYIILSLIFVFLCPPELIFGSVGVELTFENWEALFYIWISVDFPSSVNLCILTIMLLETASWLKVDSMFSIYME